MPLALSVSINEYVLPAIAAPSIERLKSLSSAQHSLVNMFLSFVCKLGIAWGGAGWVQSVSQTQLVGITQQMQMTSFAWTKPDPQHTTFQHTMLHKKTISGYSTSQIAVLRQRFKSTVWCNTCQTINCNVECIMGIVTQQDKSQIYVTLRLLGVVTQQYK